ncbi:hypothetical protein DID78_06115 [Candidatus Marinamargulisbacteria bacterium SCGC AG-343-D04]|nr:hypothetical protein DID78_06115 [Candidatus Marinamargulisbacteria bacterium SCGC AG-343-D04]
MSASCSGIRVVGSGGSQAPRDGGRNERPRRKNAGIHNINRDLGYEPPIGEVTPNTAQTSDGDAASVVCWVDPDQKARRDAINHDQTDGPALKSRRTISCGVDPVFPTEEPNDLVDETAPFRENVYLVHAVAASKPASDSDKVISDVSDVGSDSGNGSSSEHSGDEGSSVTAWGQLPAAETPSKHMEFEEAATPRTRAAMRYNPNEAFLF